MIHSACIKNTLTKCKTLIGHQKLLEVSMFTPADTISISTSRLKENIPDIAAITGNTLWGFSLLLSKTALNYAPTSILLSMRFIIAFLLMNLILLFKIERISLKGKNILPVLLLALNDVAYFYCESYGIALTNSMFTGVVLSLIPILAMGLSALFLKEFPTLRQILFSFLPVAGVVIIILAGSSSGAIQPVGILFVLSACFLSATQRVINRKAAVNFSAFERTYFTICSSCLFFTTNAVHQLGGNAMKLLHYATIPGFIIPVLILSIFCSVTCNILVNYAAGKMSVGRLAAFSNLQTMWSMFAGVLFLREPFGLSSFIGSVLIIYGIWHVTKRNIP